MTEPTPAPPTTSHRFLDEAGDTTFYGAGKKVIVGEPGVSLAFSLGSVKFRSGLEVARQAVVAAQRGIETDPLVNVIPSVAKKITKGGFYFHATDDPPEVRATFLRLIKTFDCGLEIVVARKDAERFRRKHNNREAEFYADVLSHLLKNKLKLGQRLVLTIAQRGKTTRNATLELARRKAMDRFCKTRAVGEITSEVLFNVQNPRTEPLLCVADYLCWTVQRVFERGETRYYDFVREKISVIIDLYDATHYAGGQNYYKPDRPLTGANKLSPPAP